MDLIAFQTRATSTDDGVAIDTLTEGEAMIHPNMLVARLYRANPRNVDWDSYIRDMRSSAFEVIDGARAPFIDAMQVLPYPVGFRFLLGPWLDGGQRAIDDLYRAPLLSFGQWAYADGPGQLRPTDPLACFPTSPPPGFSGFDHDRLGVTGLIGLRVALGTTAALAFDTAATLEDDSLVVFTAADPAQAVAVAWRLRFNADSAASSLVEAIRRAPGGEFDRLLVEIVDQREVLIRAMSDPSLLPGWTTGADCGRAEDLPLRPEQAEAPSALSRRVLRWRGARR